MRKNIKVFDLSADIKFIIKENNAMLKKIISPSCNICDSVEFILRGARKRRSLALASARNVNADAGIEKVHLRAVK